MSVFVSLFCDCVCLCFVCARSLAFFSCEARGLRGLRRHTHIIFLLMSSAVQWLSLPAVASGIKRRREPPTDLSLGVMLLNRRGSGHAGCGDADKQR
jgi:hypothetical protein